MFHSIYSLKTAHNSALNNYHIFHIFIKHSHCFCHQLYLSVIYKYIFLNISCIFFLNFLSVYVNFILFLFYFYSLFFFKYRLWGHFVLRMVVYVINNNRNQIFFFFFFPLHHVLGILKRSLWSFFKVIKVRREIMVVEVQDCPSDSSLSGLTGRFMDER